MRFKPPPCKRYDSFSVQHKSNIASDTERRRELIGTVSRKGNIMLIFVNIQRVDWSFLVVSHDHFGYSRPLLWTIIILNIRVNKNVLVPDHDVKALINNLPIPFAIDHISDLVSLEGEGLPPFNDPCGFSLYDV